MHRFRSFSRVVHAFRLAPLALLLLAALVLLRPEVASATQIADRAPIPKLPLPFHPISYIPIVQIPTEDVDFVPATVFNPVYPEMGVWPVEGMVHFFDLMPFPPTLIASIPTASANISGVDFITDGTWGLFQTLGFGYMYQMNGPGSLPALTATIALPGGVPNRRDLDPFIFPDLATPFGVSALYTSGMAVHCRAIPAGVVRWDVPLPGPIVEAVDPVYSPSGKIFVPCEGFMVVIDAATGAVLSTTALPASLVREVDVTLTGTTVGGPGPPLAWLPTATTMMVFDDTPGSLGASVAVVPTLSPLIEGNDFEIDPSGGIGYLPTLAFMHQFNLFVPAIGPSWPLGGLTHQRNQDVIFTPPTCGCGPKWAYAMQGFMLIGDNLFGSPPPAILPSPGTLVDGVDPAFSDTPPYGASFSVPTLASTNVYDATAVAFLGAIARTPGSGALRVDADHKPAPVGGNYIAQPTIGGLLSVSGFGPNEWVVTTALGVEVVDLGTLTVSEFIPYAAVGGGMTFRGGDAQPTFMAGAGPLEPAFSVDAPDQDFVTKCWEYKYATNRIPYWYSVSMPAFYPQYVPYGVFGPPAQEVFDILNNYSVALLANDDVAIMDEHGSILNQFALPGRPIGGIVWDQDNKCGKVRCTGQLEVVINVSSMPVTGNPVVTVVPYGNYTRWYPIIDRMNGWEFVVMRGGKQLWVYDHVNLTAVATINLPARITRQPVFDDQRKTLCMTLGNRRVAFFNAHNYRMGFPASKYLFYSPVLAANVAAAPVFDIYNHLAVLQLQDSRLVVLSNATGALLWDSGVLPYRPICPIQIDCYNNIAKGYYRDVALNTHYELWLNLYPLAFSASPVLQWIPFNATPYGYPVFYSRGCYELSRLDSMTIQFRNIIDITKVTNLTTPRRMTGSILLDRVNGYALCPLQGRSLYYIDLYRQGQGLSGAAHIINIPSLPSASTNDDIVFSTQTLQAVGSLSDGSVYLIDLKSGTYVSTPSFSGLPKVRRQLYTNPVFSERLNLSFF